MTTKKSLGVYFGGNYLSIAEVANKKLFQFFNSPHNLSESEGVQPQNIPDEIKLTAVIQKSLRDRKIESTDVTLSLRIKDIILRSFFIPWMTTNEVKGVVEFEINRYIPFKLDELAYTYHSTTITEDKTKRIRILFVAIRKDILEKYCAVLEQSNLKVIAIEPEPLSLIRLLTFKKFFQLTQTTAIIHAENKEGAIIIVEDGVPQFIREFRLGIPSVTNMGLDYEGIKSRLFNEIRISLDYYSRQHTQSKIDKILFLSSIPAEVTENLGKDLGLASASLNAHSVLEIKEETPLGTLNAFGAGLKKSVAVTAHIDLSKSRQKEKEAEEEFVPKPINLTRIAQVGAVCAGIFLIVFLFSFQKTSSYQAKLSQLAQRQGPYEALSIEEINKKRDDTIKKLGIYKNVNLRTDVAYFLKRIPELLPQGAWLTNLSIDYSDIALTLSDADKQKKTGKDLDKMRAKAKINIMMDGYIYADDINEQINLANRLPAGFKSDQNFFNYFQEAKLLSVRKENLADQTVTFFQISLK